MASNLAVYTEGELTSRTLTHVVISVYHSGALTQPPVNRLSYFI
jgi:hypothetical protein